MVNSLLGGTGWNLRIWSFQNDMFNVTEIGKKWNNPSRKITARHKMIPTRRQVALDFNFSIACDMLHVKLYWGHVVFLVAFGRKVEAKIHNRDRTWTTLVATMHKTNLVSYSFVFQLNIPLTNGSCLLNQSLQFWGPLQNFGTLFFGGSFSPTSCFEKYSGNSFFHLWRCSISIKLELSKWNYFLLVGLGRVGLAQGK